ncbi:MAG: SDR family oxidoreductase, partial [Thermoanaerobaculales bacterium]
MLELDGRAAVVTGGSKGIGFAIARMLVEHGAAVAIGAREQKAVDAAVASLEAVTPGRTRGFCCDVRRREDCERLIGEAVGAFGRLDILINNAGIGVFASVEETSDETWRAQLATNLDGAFYCCRAALPHLKEQGGWIVNIGSLAGKNPFAGGAAYNASKFGLLGFSEALMLEVRHAGVRVTCVMPGSVGTSFAGGRHAVEDWKLAPEDIAQVVRDLLAFPE